MNLSPTDVKKLEGVHPDLQKVVKWAAEWMTANYPNERFIIVEGVRTLAKQREYYQAGKSKTMKSRHLTGHAVDIAPYVDTDGDGDVELSWNKRDFLHCITAMKEASKALNIPLTHGASWGWDFPHHELKKEKYP